MRKLKIPLLILTILLLLCSSALAMKLRPEDEGFTVMSENASMALLLDEKNMNVRLVNLSTGDSWDTCALDGANENNAFTLVFQSDPEAAATAAMDSYSKSISQGNYAIEPVENGFEVTYEVGDSADFPHHTLKMRYQLIGDEFVATLPTSEIKSTDGNEITYIDIMPCFATAADTAEGFVLMPDGTGGVVRLSNQKTAAYSGKVYGTNLLLSSSSYTLSHEELSLPLMGLCKESSGVLAIIEKGAEVVTLGADISGSNGISNRMNMRFMLRNANNPSADTYNGDIVIRYRFLKDEGFRLMAENANRALLLNEDIMNVRLVNLSTGENWDSIVPNGKKGNKTIKNTQKSAFTLAFISDAKRATLATMDSYSNSVSLGNYSLSPVKNGFEVSYEVGDDTLIIDDLPKGIRVDKYFNLRDNAGWSSKEKKDFEGQYRAVKLAGLEQEYMIRVKDDSLGALEIKKLYGLLFTSGLYTQEDMEEDNEAVGYTRKYLPRHTITVRYQLSGDDFIVTLPLGTIKSTEDNDITYIDLMPYLMTAADTADGFMLVPDGSGGIIHLNNQKLAATSYTGKVYGPDVLINSSTYALPRDEIALPMMGLNKNGSGILALIEKGAEIATIGAEISGNSDEFNRMSLRFTLRDIENVALAGNDSITTPRYASDVYEGDIVVRYKLLDSGNADVAGMANAYRQYLIDSGILTPREPSEHAPFYAELIGAVAKDKFFLGIPYQSSVQATNFSEAAAIYDSLKDKGLENIHLIYSGLFYGGVKHAALTDLTLDSGLGKPQQLKELTEKLKENGDFFYPGVYFGRVYSDRDFSTLRDAARRHDGEPATVSVFGEPIMKLARQNTKGYYISPYYLGEYVHEVKEELSEYEFSGLNIFDLGNTLTPDYKRKQNLSRIHATAIYQDTLDSLSASYRLLLDKPMLYALPYADAALMLPERDNGFKLIDEAVPFVQYVLSGCMDISGDSWNLKGHLGIEKQLLWALEALESPRFTFTAQSPIIFQNTNDMDYMSYFSTVYTDWVDKAAGLYEQYDAFYQMVSKARISKHEVISDTVRKVSYDNGVSILLNYGQTEAIVDGETVPAQGYRIQEEVQP